MLQFSVRLTDCGRRVASFLNTTAGHRFAELHGHTWGAPTLDTIKQRVMHSDVESYDVAQSSPRTLAGSIAFGNGAAKELARTKPAKQTLKRELVSVPATHPPVPSAHMGRT